jgi:hypothetical protein
MINKLINKLKGYHDKKDLYIVFGIFIVIDLAAIYFGFKYTR